MRIYPWTVQINRQIVKDWGGSRAATQFVYGDTFLLAAKIEDFDYTTNALAPKDFTADGGNPMALRVLIRKERDSSSTLYSFQDTYNAGEIPGFGDLTLGQVEWPISLSDSQIKTDLDTAGGSLSAWLEISYLDANDIPSTLVQQEITIVDQVDDGAAGTPPPDSPTYLTATEVATSYVSKTKQMFWGVLSATTTTPPTLTGGESKYIIPTGATGAWSGHDGKIAVDDGSWTYYTPSAGWTATAVDEKDMYYYISGAWVRFNGNPVQVSQAAHGLSVGNAVYNNAGTWAKAQADDADTLGVAIVVEVADVDNFTYQTVGPWTSAAHGYTVGEYLLVSPSTAGALTETAPTGFTEFSNPIAYVLDDDTLLIFPWRPFQAVERSNDKRVTEIDDTDSPYSTLDVDEFIKADATSGAIIVNLPTTTAAYESFTVSIKKIDSSSNTVTIKAASGNIEGILGTTGYVLTLFGDVITLTFDGTDWWISE